jgi:serine/threonine-protein kinase
MRDRARMRPQQGSIIDKLIEEALLEFTSLKPDEAQAGADDKRGGQSSSPLDAGQFVDPTNWAHEIAIMDPARAKADALRANLPADVFAEGNLSALEDGEPNAPASPHMPARAPTPVPPEKVLPGPMQAAAARVAGPTNAKAMVSQQRGKGMLVGAAILAVAALCAIAWFTGVIRH